MHHRIKEGFISLIILGAEQLLVFAMQAANLIICFCRGNHKFNSFHNSRSALILVLVAEPIANIFKATVATLVQFLPEKQPIQFVVNRRNTNSASFTVTGAKLLHFFIIGANNSSVSISICMNLFRSSLLLNCGCFCIISVLLLG